MAELIHEHSARIKGRDGGTYLARIHGQERADGTWEGWIEFHALKSDGRVVRTGQESSQPDRRALEYWAGGIQPVYLEGALGRATPKR
ncbi:MAG TPA: hypothetical protein VMM18_00970 [Gemmatimonadaceae bacterium]|nr:hypothetical protein [Gemmatimonadaceae bacterium]